MCCLCSKAKTESFGGGGQVGGWLCNRLAAVVDVTGVTRCRGQWVRFGL